MTKKLSQFVLIVVLIVLTSVASLLMLAQRGDVPLRVVATSSQGIRFYGNDANGDLQAIGDFLPNFAVESLGGNAEWLIYSQENLAASPNGQYIAFTAYRGDEAALFIYTVSSQSLSQTHIVSYSFLPSWSPDSEAILLAHGIPYWGDSPLPSDYVYELASDSVIQVTGVPADTFQWSPDGDSLIYLGSCLPESCGNPSADLYWLSRDGSNRFPITDFPTQVDIDKRFIDVCHLTWFPDTQRWYYVMGCTDTFNNPNIFVYSTDLNGDNRLELDVEEYLKSTDGAGLTMQEGVVKGIEMRSDGIYMSLQLSFYPDADVHPEIEEPYLFYQLRVLRLTAQGQLDLIHQQELSDFGGPTMSPDGQHMALRHDGAIIVSLASDEDPIVVPNLSDEEDRAVCDFRWLDNQNIIYNVGGHQCFFITVVEGKEVWSFNFVTNERKVLTEGLGDHAWLLPSVQN